MKMSNKLSQFSFLVSGLLSALFALTSFVSVRAEGAETGAKPKVETAIFAGGCFWCVESDFEKLPGVLEAKSGYTGGEVKNPTYEQVSSGTTGHVESVEVTFDPSKVSYEQLVEYFWKHVDPTRDDGQFCDSGKQYRPEIFVKTAEQRKTAESSKAKLESDPKWKGKVKVLITEATQFYLAEDYHQDYYKKNPIRYAYYRKSCRRDQRVEELWGTKR